MPIQKKKSIMSIKKKLRIMSFYREKKKKQSTWHIHMANESVISKLLGQCPNAISRQWLPEHGWEWTSWSSMTHNLEKWRWDDEVGRYNTTKRVSIASVQETKQMGLCVLGGLGGGGVMMGEDWTREKKH